MVFIHIIADTHTHTVACDHAFSTLRENVMHAREVGLRFLCCTEHVGEAMPGGASDIYFRCLVNLPRFIDDVMILRGAEVNIVDHDGTIDLSDQVIGQLEWVIASYHTPAIRPGSELDHTKCWIEIAQNPDIHVIGHCGDPRYAFEYRPVLEAFKAGGKIVEINAHSFSARKGSFERCRRIAELCAEYGIPLVVSSDAHFYLAVGEVCAATDMLGEIGFPEELVLNADRNRFLETVRRTSGKPLTNEA